MPHSKKKLTKGLTRKKVSNINPREYTLMGSQPDLSYSHIPFNPSGEAMSLHPISHKLEKWILIVLLAFAMAAFMGFKLLENSDLAFSLTDGANQTTASAAASLSSTSDFKTEFDKNRNEARALMESHNVAKVQTTPKYGKKAIKLYAKNKTTKKLAAKKSSHKNVVSKSLRKKTIARR